MKMFFLLPLMFASAAHAATLCESGQRQSPININSQAVRGPRQAVMELHYRSAPLRLANDGHTARIRFDKGSVLVLGKERFNLQQFHFHTPGGDQIDGEPFPFAAHILHKNAAGQLLAIVVPFRLGSENALLKQLLPLIPAKAGADVRHPQVQLSAASLLPTNLGYFRYSGSLTDKPCTENVEWLVMKHPQELSAAQLKQWQSLFKDNMRAINPDNGRVVLESLQ